VTQTLPEPTLTSRSAQSPLLQMTKTTPTVLWNDSADPAELTASLTWGCVGATCNPVIAHNTIMKHPDVWVPRIREIAERRPTAGEAEIAWQAVKDMTVKEFEDFGSSRTTLRQFLAADADLDSLVRDIIVPDPRIGAEQAPLSHSSGGTE